MGVTPVTIRTARDSIFEELPEVDRVRIVVLFDDLPLERPKPGVVLVTISWLMTVRHLAVDFFSVWIGKHEVGIAVVVVPFQELDQHVRQGLRPMFFLLIRFLDRTLLAEHGPATNRDRPGSSMGHLLVVPVDDLVLTPPPLLEFFSAVSGPLSFDVQLFLESRERSVE